MNVHHDAATPTLSVIDPRSLMIRSVGYCRHPDSPGIDPRITRQVFDAAGHQIAAWDPRLWGTAPKPNLATTYGLSGQALLTDSVDAGWQLSLPDQAGSLRCSWDARGSECHRDYDDLLRTIVVTEQARGELPRVVERLSYADAGDAFAQHNQCGRLIRHDDPAGTRFIHDYGLAGAELVESRRMLTDLDLPDWPRDPEHRDVFLEEQSYVTRYVFFPTGELKEQTDAMGNAQTCQYNVAGKLSATWLLPASEGKQPTRLVGAIRYNAHEQIEQETAGNDVTTHAEYSPEDGRLLKLSAAVGEQTPLQDLHYVYDPVGNIVSLEDKTQAVTYFNQQRIDPVSRYRYDSLYQLVEAKDWEVSQPSHGPALPDLLPTPLDPNQRRNYTQTFAYDAAGNLLTRHHSGAPGFSMFTSANSNRSLAQRDDGSLPGEPQISEGFDLAGNQLELQRGQAMSWDVRNQLRRVTLVRRQDEPNDDEGYVYDRPGHRLRKTRLSQTSGQTLKSEVRYLPGLEVHREKDGVERHVISVEAGRNQVRMLHWPDGAESDQLRYSLGDHLGSSVLELDDGAGILSQEHYYPFGGTACWAGKSALVAKYKTIRYSGKERDATGLYYYGYRYYASWLQRWINADPAGPVNGLNIFIFVSDNPIKLADLDGRVYQGKDDIFEKIGSGIIVARGVAEFPPDKQALIIDSFREVEHIYASAEAAMSSDLVDHAKILESYFGSEYETVKVRVLESFKKGQEWARMYQEPSGQDKIVGVFTDIAFAWVYKDDRNGRIFLNVNSFERNRLTHTLGHEVTHLKEVDGIAGIQAMDYFYLPGKMQRPGSENFMKGKVPDDRIVNAQLPNARREFIIGVARHSGVDPFSLDYDTAASLFNQNPRIRTQMAAENADSIMAAATELSHRFSDSQEFHKLLYG
ncbi:RHS repeat protein [Pseudomonas fluorescens]|uniref:RHS repeat-associated core domain-containing protein n=1 Tax=Pseudomonas fluorescens TaxID=294 RepID=UPI0011329C82|nr:RHS repeat-associated core domain-containing protein [Pseudomonas fluorescens]TMU72209.1 RHS repeat protein [Pseudomonas fluorescens]